MSFQLQALSLFQLFQQIISSKHAKFSLGNLAFSSYTPGQQVDQNSQLNAHMKGPILQKARFPCLLYYKAGLGAI